MKKIVCLLNVCFILLSIAACVKQAPRTQNNYVQLQDVDEDKSFNKKIKNTDSRDQLPMVKNGQKGVALGLYGTDGKIENGKVFNLKSGESFEKFISISHINDEKWTYKLFLLVDYQKKGFKVDGKLLKDYTFRMNPNETIEIPVEIEALPDGFHDALFVIAKYPDVKRLDKDFRIRTDMNHLLFIRFNVIVNNGKAPEITLNTQYEKMTNISIDGLFINRNKKELKVWYKDKIKPNMKLDYYLHIGNKYGNNRQRYALFTLLDWELVPIGDNETKVLFFEVQKGHQIIIPASLKTPMQEGIYDFTPVLVEGPYENLNLSRGHVETSLRVGLDIVK